MLQTTCQLAMAEVEDWRPLESGNWAGLTRTGGLHSYWKADAADLPESMLAGRMVPLRQQKGILPTSVSLALDSGRSRMVGDLSQLTTLEKSRSW
ncbi:unnamed protein product [Spirodela intermedia]|uniref:Uncharacterized protein n=1 Tax=Spirodela intermedia TaxID=51605 RepID=A0A7I8JZR0_SPIIN|nr:unnamed protein product [Spirodela intermedia]